MRKLLVICFICILMFAGCGTKDFEKEENIPENIVKKAEFIDEFEKISVNDEEAYIKFDELLNQIYGYLRENMKEEEFNKLKEDEIKWIAKKENAIKDSIDENIAIEYTYKRCCYLISLLDELKYRDVAILKAGETINEIIGHSVIKVVFDNYNKNSYGFEWGKGRDVSQNEDKSIQLFKKEKEVYILSQDIIYANSELNNISNSMFSGCGNLISLTLNNFDTSNVENMSSMFSGCGNLTSLTLNNFDTSNVENMSSMFSDCKNLKSLDISSFNTSNVTNMSHMFSWCYNLTNLDLQNFNTSNVENMSFMFSDCKNLKSLDISNFNTSNVIYMNSMFNDCECLTSLNLNSFNTTNVESMGSMFSDCKNLTSLQINNFDTSKVLAMSYMFDGCSSLTKLDVSNFDTSNVTDMNRMFDSCKSLTNLDVSNFDVSKVESFYEMFNDCSNLKSLDVSNFNTSSVKGYGLYGMFKGCRSLMTLDLSNFYTYKVTNMSYMFDGCENLASLDISNFSTNKTINKTGIFNNCYKLHDIDRSKINDFLSEEQRINKLLDIYIEEYSLYENNSIGTFPSILEMLNLETDENIQKLITENRYTDGNFKTNVKYEDFRQAMLKMVTERYFDENFSNYINIDGYVSVDNGAGGIDPVELESIEFISYDDNTNTYIYNAKIKDVVLYEIYQSSKIEDDIDSCYFYHKFILKKVDNEIVIDDMI